MPFIQFPLPEGRGSFRARFLPKEEQSRHSREGGNPAIPHDTEHSAWMPAGVYPERSRRAGMTILDLSELCRPFVLFDPIVKVVFLIQ